MRTTQLIAAALVMAACSHPVSVRTEVAPDAGLASRHTFRILPVPARRVDAAAAYSDDPMLANSITNRSLVDDLERGFTERGYTLSTSNADFAVAYYASVRDKLNIDTWNYGYARRGWPRPYADVTEYTEGTVIIDVIDPATMNLLWRGQGVAAVSDDPGKYMNELGKTVTAILKDFPQAQVPASAGL